MTRVLRGGVHALDLDLVEDLLRRRRRSWRAKVHGQLVLLDPVVGRGCGHRSGPASTASQVVGDVAAEGRGGAQAGDDDVVDVGSSGPVSWASLRGDQGVRGCAVRSRRRRTTGPPNRATDGAARGDRRASGLGLGDEVDGVADGVEVLDLVVGDAHAELLLGVDDDRHHRQRVDVEVVGERLVELDGVGRVEPGLLVDDLGQAGEDLLLAAVPWWCSFDVGCLGRVLMARCRTRGPTGARGVRAGRRPARRRPARRRSRSAGRGRRWGTWPSRSRRSVASGMEAAEVLPVSAMSRATTTSLGQLELLDHRVDDPHVRLVRDEGVEVGRR